MTDKRTEHAQVNVTVRVPAHWVGLLDKIAKSRGMTRSHLLRGAMSSLFAEFAAQQEWAKESSYD